MIDRILIPLTTAVALCSSAEATHLVTGLSSKSKMVLLRTLAKDTQINISHHDRGFTQSFDDVDCLLDHLQGLTDKEVKNSRVEIQLVAGNMPLVV